MIKFWLFLCSGSLCLVSLPIMAQSSISFPVVGELSHQRAKVKKSLAGVKILINPGHGGKETGAIGPNGYFAKDANLYVSKLLATELQKYGATVVMTRKQDQDLSLSDRQAMINREQPTIALTIHYTFANDDEDAETAEGIRTFWYHPQSQSLAVFIHNYLTNKLKRSSRGVFWNNLALTRPEIAPVVVLELGFFSHPTEFEWITKTEEQKKLATTLAQAINRWFQSRDSTNPK